MEEGKVRGDNSSDSTEPIKEEDENIEDENIEEGSSEETGNGERGDLDDEERELEADEEWVKQDEEAVGIKKMSKKKLEESEKMKSRAEKSIVFKNRFLKIIWRVISRFAVEVLLYLRYLFPSPRKFPYYIEYNPLKYLQKFFGDYKNKRTSEQRMNVPPPLL
eukprot:TRINITY_DN2471_c0_g1_i1.p1 TRINITY_DN2471_c0_g1~~TRINITY_DN2471_c0_g1_i1.p1  ORF type:complete len:163 (-),score=56.57 TRINITY_DN2471_c0_g1_i1:125-613(-)